MCRSHPSQNSFFQPQPWAIGDPGGYLTKFYTGRHRPEAFYTLFLTEKVPSIEKWYPFHIPCLEFCILLERFSYSWNENPRTKQKNQTNGNSAIWLVYRTDLTNARGFWLVKRTLGWKKIMTENFLENNGYFALTSYCNTIGQSNDTFSVIAFSLAEKLRVHVLIFSSIGW